MNMGKFPGKPSKSVNRKRVNASKCPSSQENDSVKAAENIYFGLTVFNEAFGSEQVTADFLGFTTQEIKSAVVYAKKQHREVEAEYAAHGLTSSLKESFEKELQQLRVNQCQRAPTKNVVRRTRKQCFDGGGGGDSSDNSANDGAKREVPLLKKLISKSPPNSTTFLKNKAAKKLLQKAKKSNSFGSGLPVDAQQDKGNGVVRKFVLPSRSVHSSRVIKPNKRFIEGEEVLSDLSANKSANVIQLKKPRLIVNSSIKTTEFPSGIDREGSSAGNPFLIHQSSKEVEQFPGYNSSDGNSHSLSPQSSSLIVEGKRRWKPSYKVQLKLRELNVFGAGTTRFALKRTQGSSSCSTRSVQSSEKEKSEPSVNDSDSRRFYNSAQSETKPDLHSGHWTGPKLNGSKVILRKARLKLNTESPLGTDGPFSGSVGSGNSVLPTTVQCGVCGAVKSYRFVKQARKFGIYSCESCRKFISQMVKRHDCHKGGTMPIVECYKGEGKCIVPPILPSQQWKPGRGAPNRCAYKSRCPACWLKKCLRSFKMPDALRSSMIQMLPAELRRDLEKPTTSYPMASDRLSTFIKPPLLEGDRPRLFNPLEGFGQTKVGSSFQSLLNSSWQGLSSPLTSSSARARRKAAHNAAKQLGRKRKQKDRSGSSISDKTKKVKHLHSNKILKKATKKLGKSKGNLGSPTEHIKKKNKNAMKIRKKNGGSRVPGSDETRRQKLDLKGPRVKHVCRSASIVLGQPQATFPSIERKTIKIEEQPIQEPVKVNTKNSCCSDSSVKSHDGERSSAAGDQLKVTKVRTTAEKNHENVTQPSQCSLSGDNGIGIEQEIEPTSQTTNSGRKATKPVNTSSANATSSQPIFPLATLPQVAHTLPLLGKRAAPEHLNQISIDFWESYDPEEVANTGFGLIGSEAFHVRATCFLCGSAGREKLVHCALCCEPYHVFCLEDGSRDLTYSSGEEWRYNWVCQRCTVCHLCGRGLGQQLSCQRCHRTYHTECLGPDRLSSRLHSPDRPWVCSTCLRCKSCGAADVTVFVGNLPLCKVCFKLRQKGNYCPLCQRCYEDDDYDTKMMECGQCRCWVHARCEGLSDEKYQVLSYLPDSVEFVCRNAFVEVKAPNSDFKQQLLLAEDVDVTSTKALLIYNYKTCSASVRPRWRIAVEEELKAGYLGVLKALSKNRKACAMLKWSPKKQCLCRSALVAKRLDFQEASDRETETDDQSDSAKEDARVSEKHRDPAQTIVSYQVKKLPIVSELPAAPDNQESAFQNFNSKETPQISSESAALVYVSEAQTDPIDSSCTTNEQQPVNTSSSTEARVLHVGSNKALKHLREKFKIKECSVRVENCIPKPSPKLPLTVKIDDHDSGFSPDSYLSECSKSPPKIQVTSMATPASDSGIGSTDDEFKPSCIEEVDESKDIASGFSHAMQTSQLLGLAYAADRHISELETTEKSSDGQESVKNEVTKECFCLNQHNLGKPSPTLLSIKKKVSANEYSSLSQFHQEMEQLIGQAQCADLLETYHHSLKEVFPWFDPKYARVDNNWKDGRPAHEENSSALSIKSEQEHSTSEEPPLNKSATPAKLDNKPSDPLLEKNILSRNDEYHYSGYTVEDRRVCILCKGVGDGLPVEEGRLLYCGQNEWVHANCALWSAEVFEEIDGSLQNVHSAVSRGRMIRCRSCGKKGASVGCCARNCAETFHFPCARRVGCAFMDDKSVFCRTHLVEADGKPLHLDVEFDIRRPIYVELDRKKKKFAEAHQIRFMIGSLMVENLGEFVPASDNPDIIVPADFRCTRLYWSSIEPWRLVRYYIRTMVKAAEPQLVFDLGKNLTVDHTQEQKLVKQKLDEVSRWHQQLICSSLRLSPEKMDITKPKCAVEPDDREERLQLEESEEDVVRQLLDNLVDVVCNKDVDDNCLADPQAAADLLPPELKDAIFEDLPHDLLDGISMQDIFPKLLNCEDLVTMDLKAEECFVPDVSKENCDDLLSDEVDQISPCEDDVDHLKCRKSEHTECELGTQTDLWFGDSKEQDNVESKFHSVYMRGAAQKNAVRELKRSKSEVIPQVCCKSGRSHQRSCSLTWTCKLDGSTKRRKAVRGAVPRTGGESGSSLLMVVDSDKAHMLQELRLPDGVLVALARSDPSVAESVRELKCRLEEGTKKEEGKENKCLLWHGVRSQPRILQLDGAMDSGSSSGSEMGSPPHEREDHDYYFPARSLPNNTTEEEPVKCDRCHRTYRTRISFERHLPTCSSDFTLSTSESDSENTRSSEEETSGKPKMSTVIQSQVISVPEKKNAELVRPSKNKQAEEAVTEMPVQPIVKKTDTDVPPRVVNPQPRGKASAGRGNTFNGRSRGRTARSQLRKETGNPQVVVSMPASSPQTQTLSCQSQTTPTVIMQQVQSPNMVPAFVEAFQQQTGQSLQYIATIDAHSNNFSKPQYLATASVPGTFQLQSTPEGYVGLQNGGISMLPGVQIAAPQPAVIGTLIHQTPPTTIQCVAAEQVVLGSTPALEMYTDQAGGMYLASQPMYYGLETIVSNTVMSSSQFVSAAVPGMMAASSSFSATTTQVFQASKIVEPVVDCPPPGFVIVNQAPPAAEHPGLVPRPDMLSCPQQSLPVNVPVPTTLPQQPQAVPVQPPQPQPMPSPQSQPIPPPQPQPLVPPAPLPPPVPPPPLVHLPQPEPLQPIPQHIPPSTPQLPYPWRYAQEYTSSPEPPTTIAVTKTYSRAPRQTIYSAASSNVMSATHCKCNQHPTSVATPQVDKSVVEIPKVTKLQESTAAEVPVRTVNKVYPMKVMPPTDKIQTSTQVIRDPLMESANSEKDVREPERKVTVIPITQNKNGNNHVNKPNSLKLIFQKQTQDGFYKISNQNVVPKPADLKTNSVSSQTIPVRSVKVKPRILTVVEKHKDSGKLASNLQTANKVNGTPSALQLQNAKIPPLKQKVSGSNNNNSTSSITYEVHSQDGFSCTSSSITEVWQKVFEAVQEAREAHKMPRLPENPFATASAGLQMLGFRHNALRYLVEQLPGIGRCVKYKPRYHKLRPPGPEDDVDALPKENASGCARSEPFKNRSPYDMFSWLASRHRQPPKLLLNAENESISNRRATCSHLPMAMRFRHLKGMSKKAVGVYRSRIHGRGLFCLRDIEAGEMVIEYAGEVIRSMLTDKREKYYESKGIGCYMFRIDDQLVVDATMRGNAARFINHSCEPNCYSRVVDILGKKHILIFALRRIPQGEELTYDYKFPFEDIKIPCTCGSRKCRKYLN